MSWFSNLFDTTVEIEVEGKKKLVSKREFDKIMNKAIAEGKAKRLCNVHILELIGTVRLEEWVCDPENEKWQDNAGDLYAVEYFENGEPQYRIIKKNMWKEMAAIWRKQGADLEKSVDQLQKKYG